MVFWAKADDMKKRLKANEKKRKCIILGVNLYVLRQN